MLISIHSSSIFLALLATVAPTMAGDSCCFTDAKGLVSGASTFTGSCCSQTGGTIGTVGGPSSGSVVRYGFDSRPLAVIILADSVPRSVMAEIQGISQIAVRLAIGWLASTVPVYVVLSVRWWGWLWGSGYKGWVIAILESKLDSLSRVTWKERALIRSRCLSW